MITIATFSKPEEANLVRCRLESAGIPVFIRDELTIQMDWLYSNALGGVRVDVPEEHLEAARELLALPPLDQPIEPANSCPRCEATTVIEQQWPRRVAYISLLLASFPLLLSRKRWKCQRCKYRWR